jgi:hypothetical protein
MAVPTQKWFALADTLLHPPEEPTTLGLRMLCAKYSDTIVYRYNGRCMAALWVVTYASVLRDVTAFVHEKETVSSWYRNQWPTLVEETSSPASLRNTLERAICTFHAAGKDTVDDTDTIEDLTHFMDVWNRTWRIAWANVTTITCSQGTCVDRTEEYDKEALRLICKSLLGREETISDDEKALFVFLINAKEQNILNKELHCSLWTRFADVQDDVDRSGAPCWLGFNGTWTVYMAGKIHRSSDILELIRWYMEITSSGQ